MNHTFIIAEAGVNHNGDLGMALRLVDEAKRAGADAVKFQTFHADDLVTKDAPQAEYQKENAAAVSQHAMLRGLELSDHNHRILVNECRRVGIEFMSTPFSVDAAKFLYGLGMSIWKIPSGEITNLPLLEYVASVAETIIMSTGMCTESEVAQAVSVLLKAGATRNNLYLLHCTTAYPAPLDEVNLRQGSRRLRDR